MILAGVGLAWSAFAQSLSPAQTAILHRVDDHYNHLQSMRTHYVEHYSGMGLNRTEAGTLLLRKPGKMRWMYERPAGKLFLLDGKTAWFYTPGDPQAQFLPAKKVDDLRTPLRFLLGHTQLQKELQNIAVAQDPGGYMISGVPAGMSRRVRQISLQTSLAGAITAMRLEEVDGAVTEFSFSDMQENVPTLDSDFQFKLPAGVTAVSGLPPV